MNALKTRSNKKNFFGKTIPLYAILIGMVLSGFSVYQFFPRPAEIEAVYVQKNDCPTGMEIQRTRDNKFSKPAILYDVKNESEQLLPLKETINQYINKIKAATNLSDVSVYYREMNNGAWFQINGDAPYIPASLLKVTTLITILKQAELTPSLLDKKIYFDKHAEYVYYQNIKNFQLKENHYYTLSELLNYMIEYSDNDAANLVTQVMNRSVYNKVYSDLGITSPASDPSRKKDFTMSVIDCCKLFRVLYNSSYLNEEYSEYALSLLAKSTYKEGLLKNFNPNTVVAHKFGERSTETDQQLHEIGLFYNGEQPYILGVMTKGNDLKQLSTVLSDISGLVYSAKSKSI